MQPWRSAATPSSHTPRSATYGSVPTSPSGTRNSSGPTTSSSAPAASSEPDSAVPGCVRVEASAYIPPSPSAAASATKIWLCSRYSTPQPSCIASVSSEATATRLSQPCRTAVSSRPAFSTPRYTNSATARFSPVDSRIGVMKPPSPPSIARNRLRCRFASSVETAVTSAIITNVAECGTSEYSSVPAYSAPYSTPMPAPVRPAAGVW